VANRYLLVRGVHHEQQRVEWSYAFDIHCNSFFPFFLICYVLHFFFLPVLLAPLSFFSTVMANSLFCCGFMFYFYNTWQGFKGT
jgi:UNC-50 family